MGFYNQVGIDQPWGYPEAAEGPKGSPKVDLDT